MTAEKARRPVQLRFQQGRAEAGRRAPNAGRRPCHAFQTDSPPAAHSQRDKKSHEPPPGRLSQTAGPLADRPPCSAARWSSRIQSDIKPAADAGGRGRSRRRLSAYRPTAFSQVSTISAPSPDEIDTIPCERHAHRAGARRPAPGGGRSCTQPPAMWAARRVSAERRSGLRSASHRVGTRWTAVAAAGRHVDYTVTNIYHPCICL